jgi:hypothetical protein
VLSFRTKELEAVASRLGFTSEALVHCLNGSGVSECEKRLQELKAKVKSAFKQLALETHPDRHQGDDGKAEEFKQLNAAYDTISKYLNSLRVAPRPTYQIIRVVIQPQTSNSTTSTTFSSNWWTRTQQ